MRRSAVLKSLPIRKEDFVVEIGSGPAPFAYTKLIVEKYPFENLERWGDVKNTAPMIQADATRIPLKDQSCDVLFVSHVLEHMERPDEFLNEAQRCAKYIYLEFPTLQRELMYAWSFHKWVVEIQDNKLICYPNDIPQLFGSFFHRNYDRIFHLWTEERFEELNSFRYCRTDSLVLEYSYTTAMKIAIEKSARGNNKVNFAEIQKQKYSTVDLGISTILNLAPSGIRNIYDRARSYWNRRKSFPLTASLMEKFHCLDCRNGSLQILKVAIRCDACGRVYPNINGIYHFDKS